MEDAAQRHLLELAAARLLAEAHSRKAASSYDFVKIKVRLGSQLEHYYILSRFLLSRMLTVITLPPHKAVRIALDVKKHLVDHDRLDITQDELEQVLFAILRQRGYGDDYVRRYQMVTEFFQQKRPLIILIAGSACTGKSSLAQQLASRLNLPNVLQTDVLYELLRASALGELPAAPLWRRPLPPGASLVSEFQRECSEIRQALDGDLCKCIRDGKSIIIEGLHIDPGLFLLEFGDPRGTIPPGQPSSSGGPALPSVPEGGSGELPPGLPSVPEGGTGELPPGLPNPREAPEQAGRLAMTLAELRAQGAGGGQALVAAAAASTRGAVPEALAAAQQAQGPAAELGQGARRVRRTASFGDAVQRLSYVRLHRLQSPWREPSGRSLARPTSARMHSLDRGQAVFMLQQSPEEEEEEGGGGQPAAPGAEPGVPAHLQHSPRPAPCISLPPLLEGSPPGPRRSVSLPASARRHTTDGCASGRREGVEGLAALALGEGGGAAAEGKAEQPASAGGARGGGDKLEQQAGGSPRLQGGHGAPAAAPPGQQQRVQGSVAAADAAAAVAAGMGPVFVPICLSIREEEYGGLLPDWLARQARAGGGGGGGDLTVAPCAGDAEAAQRLRALQEHLRQYGASGVPVVEFSTSDMGQALDAMHNYVLQCIEIALALD